MLQLASVVRDGVRGFIRGFVRDEAQDVFEYVLIIGIITVAVLVAVVTPIGDNLINAIVEGICAALDSVDGTGTSGFILDCDEINN